MSSSDRVENAAELLRAEYLEKPALLLTAGEAAKLVAGDRVTAVLALEALEESGFLVLTPDGRFGRSARRLRSAAGSQASGRRRVV